MPIWETAAAQAGANIIGTGLGLALEKHNDKRQIRQQKALTDIQIEGSQKLTDYNTQKQLEMWNATNYAAQKEQLIKAGLNPGLMYGMGGGGGQTANISQGSAGGGNAPSGGGEVQGMGMQLGLIQAQIENIKAQTKKTQAETPNVPLTGENIQANTANTKQQTKNAEITNEILDLQRDILAVDNEIKGKTQNTEIAKAQTELGQMTQQLKILTNQADVSTATRGTQVDQIRANLAATRVEIRLKEAGINKTNEEIENIKQAVKESVQRISNMQGEIDLQKQQTEFNTSFGNQVGGIIGSVLSLIPGLKGKTQTINHTGGQTNTTIHKRQ